MAFGPVRIVTPLRLRDVCSRNRTGGTDARFHGDERPVAFGDATRSARTGGRDRLSVLGTLEVDDPILDLFVSDNPDRCDERLYTGGASGEAAGQGDE
jgi:hypothetical protein